MYGRRNCVDYGKWCFVLHVWRCYMLSSGVQRSGDAPLPNSSIEQWRLVVIVTGYTLFVT